MPAPESSTSAAPDRVVGIDPATAEAVIAIDAVLQNWRRRALRREVGQRALTDLKIGIDLAHLDVLAAIEAPSSEFGESTGETMVGSVAERLAIDPSRASRLVSEVVELGLVQRGVSQADARRTIIELTERGRAVVEAVRGYKFLIMGHFLSTWSEEDRQAFIPLLQRFASWTESIDATAADHAEEIAALAQSLVADDKPA